MLQRRPLPRVELQDAQYCPEFPDRFDSLVHARKFCSWFFSYNHEHRHSALGWHTPASVHFGTATEIRAGRQTTLNAAYVAHPERFGRKPLAPKLPEVAWINDPRREVSASVNERSVVSKALTDSGLPGWSAVGVPRPERRSLSS